MATLLDNASEAAFSLPRKERAALVHALIQSLGEIIDEGVEAAWEIEINRRLDAVKSGHTSERDAFGALASAQIGVEIAAILFGAFDPTGRSIAVVLSLLATLQCIPIGTKIPKAKSS